MIELRTLGSVELLDSGGREMRPILAQPKRLAILTYLAVASPSGYCRRDTVIGLFWPDHDTEHARGSLRQALTFLRRTLGENVIVTRGEEEIGVDPAALRCDETTFTRACDEERHTEALELYGGTFLDGLFVADASPDFERWVDLQRERLRRRAAVSAWALAQTHRASGDGAAAADLARRAVALAPDDEGELARLVRFLDEQGDRAGALAAHEMFARKLQEDYGAEPSPETQALMRNIRERLVPTGTTPAAAAERPTLDDGLERTPTDAAAVRTSTAPHRRSRAAVPLLIVGVIALAGYVAAFGHLGARASPGDQSARALYEQGRYWWNKRGKVNLLKSIGMFDQALDKDPLFAPAYSGKADAYVQLGYLSYLAPADAFPKARAAALRALQLDTTLAAPHATLGFVNMYYAWDWAGAEREFRRALALSPGYATGHEWYGLFLAAMGRFDEAMAQERRAQELDPLSLAVAGTAGWVMYYGGRSEDAERELKIALRVDSTFAVGHFYLGRVYEANGALDSALAEFGATGPLRHWVPTVAAIGYVDGVLGRRQEALATLAEMDSLSRREYVTSYAMALVHAALGQQDSAFDWLDRGVRERTHWLVWLNRDPRWASLRNAPRFQALVRHLGLPR